MVVAGVWQTGMNREETIAKARVRADPIDCVLWRFIRQFWVKGSASSCRSSLGVTAVIDS